MAEPFLRRHITALLYGTSLATLLFVLRWLELRFVIIDHAYDVYIGSLALCFTGLGIWLALKLTSPKVETVVVEKLVHAEEAFVPDEGQAAKFGLSVREVEVLQLMADGLSNREIAERLFVSTNTVKTHGSRVFEKMGVRRRTQAVEVGRRLGVVR